MLSFLSTNPSDILVILVFCLFGLDIYADIANMYCLHKEVDRLWHIIFEYFMTKH